MWPMDYSLAGSASPTWGRILGRCCGPMVRYFLEPGMSCSPSGAQVTFWVFLTKPNMDGNGGDTQRTHTRLVWDI